MKHILSYLTIMLGLALLLPACSKEDMFPGETGPKATGSVSFRKMVVEVNHNETVVRSSEVNVGDFIVEIASTTGVVEYTGTYAEMPEIITLPVGDYKVSVKSPADPIAAWDTPYYEGSQSFTVEEDKVTYVDPVVCKFANVRVTIKYDTELLTVMGDDCNVTVQTGAGGVLEFGKTEQRSGYFKYVAGEGTATLVATFRGTVEENYEENFRTYTDVAPGNHYIITYKIKSGGIDTPDVTGSISPGVNVEASVEVVNMNVNVSVDDDVLADDERPSTGEGGTDPIQPTDPDKNPPTIVVKIDGSTNYASPIDVYDGIEVKCKVDSEADGGITVFTIDIDSDTLGDDILSDVGLSSHIDLVNPGSMATDLQNTLGFPVYVGGMKDIPEFDISSFVPLLSVYGAGDHKFILTVADANGTTVKTLHFVTK